MNSKILFGLFLILLSSCGVKSPPKKYPETAIDSYIKEYTGNDDHIKKTEMPANNSNPFPSTEVKK